MNSNSNMRLLMQVLPAGLRRYRQLAGAVGGSAVLHEETLAAARGAWSIRQEEVEAGVTDAALLQLDVGLYELRIYAEALPLVSMKIVITELPPCPP